MTQTTTVFLGSNPTPVVGQSFTLQVMVVYLGELAQPNALPSPPAVTGIVSFTDGSTVLGIVPVSNGRAMYTIPALASGPHSFQASYSGDANYAASTSPVLLIGTGTTLAASSVGIPQISPPSFLAGQIVTVSTAVSASPPAAGTPTGTVTFVDNGSAVLGTASVNGTGNASITTSFQPGAQSVVAVYGGDANFSGSSSTPLSFTVGSPAGHISSTVALGASPANPTQGQAVTFTAVVTGPSGSGSPTGSATFMDGAATLGTSTLNAGSAVYATATLATGVHSVTAAYGGDATFAPSTSGPVIVTVGSALPVTLTFSEGSAGLTLTATVAGNGTVAPTGLVQFSDLTAGTTLAASTLSNGSAGIPVAPALAGHTVQAVYPGDSHYPAGTSSPLPLIVATNGFSAAFAAFAPDEFATIFGSSLTSTTVSATLPPPTTLGGVTATITDAGGGVHVSSMLFVSPTQVNFVVPSNTPVGAATLALTGPSLSTQVSITIANVSPGLASAAQAVTVGLNGQPGPPVVTASFNTVSQSWVPVPVNFGVSSATSLYLVLYGTGFRHGHGSTTCSANGQAMTVTFAGPQGSFPGLDQINAMVPASLQGAGLVQVTCAVDGQTSNALMVLLM